MLVRVLLAYAFLETECQQYIYPSPTFLQPAMSRQFNTYNPSMPLVIFRSSSRLRDSWFPKQGRVDWHKIYSKEEMEPPLKGKQGGKLSAISTTEYEAIPRLLFSTGAGYSAVAGLFRTYIYTSIITTTIPSISRCIPSNQFSSGARNTTCLRRKREVAEFLDDLILSDDGEENGPFSTPEKPLVTPTVIPTPLNQHDPKTSNRLQSVIVNPTVIFSSKGDVTDEDVHNANSIRSKRLFNDLFAFSTTTTIYSFVTSALSRQVNVVSVAGNSVSCNGINSFGCLICVPAGYGVC